MKRYFTFLLIPLLFTCAKPQPETSWLIIEPWEMTANPNVSPGSQGELTHAVTEAFVNMDGKMLGVFTLPAKIPVIGSGNHEFILIPGVRNNGISATKKRYPFLEQYTSAVNLVVNDTVSISPVTHYFEGLTFLIEDFENPAIQFDYANESNTQITLADDPAVLKWGNFYGQVILNDTDSLMSALSTFGQVFPKGGAEVYLELDFMNSNSMLTQVISYGNGNYFNDPYIQLNPQETPEWKHIYIDLKEIVSTRNNATFNEIGLTAVLDQVGTQKYIYLDNIKIIYN
ncbi:MAG: hypothetical protein R3277_06480 [Brumimicrobium sp.]|nr:hypothetical protein [Brumimicrobium sp.]